MSDLQTIPGVGPSIEQDLKDLNIQNVKDLQRKDPELLFEKLCTLRGKLIDRCVLYVFRCAVYYAENTKHDPELLKWWNWKNRSITSIYHNR